MKMKIVCDAELFTYLSLSVCQMGCQSYLKHKLFFYQKFVKKVEIHNEGSAPGSKMMHLVSQVRINEENSEKITYRQSHPDMIRFRWGSLTVDYLLHSFFIKDFILILLFWIKTTKYVCECDWLMLHRNMHRPFVKSHYPDLLKSNAFTVFLSGFGAFLRTEIKFSKLLVQPPHHLVTCAHHKSSFSFFWTSCDCFGTFMQLIMYICLLFPKLSVANVMLLKMYYIVLCAIVLPS